MNKINGKVAARINLDVIGVDGDVRESLSFANVMTDGGLDSWSKGILGAYLAIGSGSRTELPSVATLGGFVRSQFGVYAYTNSNFIDEPNGVMRSDLVLNVLFPVETAAQNYSEMGIHNNNANELQTYARIRDALGEPTTLGVQVGEQVRVSYVVQFSTPLLTTATQSIGGVSTVIKTIPYRTGSNNGIRLPNATPATAARFWPAGASVPAAGVAPTAGTASPKTATINNGLYSLTLNSGELNLTGGIALARIGGDSFDVGLMIHFDPPINKVSPKTLSITISVTLNNGVFYA